MIGWRHYMASVIQRSKYILAAILFLSTFVVAQAVYAQQRPPKRVLILNSYDPDHPGVALLTRTVTSTIKTGSPEPIEFFFEYQESLRISNAKYESEMVTYLRRKYEGEAICLIVTLGAPAIKFILDHESVLFSGVPRVFYFHDQNEAAARSWWPRATGLWANFEIKKTLDIALALQPDTQNVVVVSGNSNQDKFLHDEAVKEFQPYETNLKFSYLTNLTIEELKERVSGLPPGTVIVYLSYFVDKLGHSYSGPEALSRFAPSANVAIYGISETYMGAGIVGGSLLDFEALGRQPGKSHSELCRE